MLVRVTAAPPATILRSRTVGAAIVALGVGALALAAPPAAVLALALLGALVLMRGARAQLDLVAIAGPAFAAILVFAFVGLAGAIGVVFVWRLLADARWSVREAARMAEAAGRPDESGPRALAHAWLTPAFCLTVVAYTAPHMVAGLPLDLPHLPLWSVLAVGGLTVAALFDWALKCAADWRLGELAVAPALHLLTHHVVFLLAFGLTLDVSAGIVALIAWRLTHAAAAQASFTAVP